MITVKVITKPKMLPPHLDTGNEPPLLDHPLPGYFFLKPIKKYVHEKHRELVDQVMQELTNLNFEHGRVSGYDRYKCTGPLCKRAKRDHQRIYTQARYGRRDQRRRLKPQYESIDPLLERLTSYAMWLAGLIT